MRSHQMMRVTLVLLCALCTVCVADVATTSVVGTLKLPGVKEGPLFPPPPSHFPQRPAPLASITLHGPTLTVQTTARIDGKFALHQVPEGSYMLTVEVAHMVFPMLRVSVLPTRGGDLRVRAVVNDGTQLALDADATVDSPLVLTALGRHGYFVPREEVSIFSFLKNPMILMMLVSVGMMGLMKLVPQEELRAQMKEMNEQVQAGKQTLGIDKKSA